MSLCYSREYKAVLAHYLRHELGQGAPVLIGLPAGDFPKHLLASGGLWWTTRGIALWLERNAKAHILEEETERRALEELEKRLEGGE